MFNRKQFVEDYLVESRKLAEIQQKDVPDFRFQYSDDFKKPSYDLHFTVPAGQIDDFVEQLCEYFDDDGVFATYYDNKQATMVFNTSTIPSRNYKSNVILIGINTSLESSYKATKNTVFQEVASDIADLTGYEPDAIVDGLNADIIISSKSDWASYQSVAGCDPMTGYIAGYRPDGSEVFGTTFADESTDNNFTVLAVLKK